MPKQDYDTYWEGPSGITYGVTLVFDIETDPAYGADADGNRGVSLTNVDLAEFFTNPLLTRADRFAFSTESWDHEADQALNIFKGI